MLIHGKLPDLGLWLGELPTCTLIAWSGFLWL